MSLGRRKRSRCGKYRGTPVPKPRKHTLPRAVLSSADIAALANIKAMDGEIVYSIPIGYIPVTGSRSVPEPGRRVWAQYPLRA
jgi:hypothetical protein